MLLKNTAKFFEPTPQSHHYHYRLWGYIIFGCPCKDFCNPSRGYNLKKILFYSSIVEFLIMAVG